MGTMRDFTTPPPPPSRPRTPPAPKHGPRYDSYEPYSPRRSQRVLQLQQTKEAQSINRLSRISSSSQTLSPPSSPITGQTLSQQTPARSTPARQSLFTRTQPTNTHTFSPAHHLPTPSTMLPTPIKTPRKRPELKSTARVLDFNTAMAPTPRNKAKSRLTLDKDDVVHDAVHVYTDSKDRIPTRDESEDNPFLGPRKGKGKGRKRAHTVPSSKQERRIHEKGIVYFFRGKEYFRRFADDDAADSDSSTASNQSLKRKIGAAALRPLTRTDFKPRLLFPSADSDNDADSEAPTDVDEEAMTDIEEHNVPASASFGRLAQPAKALTKTPAKKALEMPTTPPSSHRQTRTAAYQMPVFEDVQDMGASSSLFSGGKRTHGEKRKGRLSLSESDAPHKRGRLSFSSIRRRL